MGEASSPLWASPISIAGIPLRNRVVYPPLSTNWGTDSGDPTEKNLEYYRRQARGGCALVVVEGTAISAEGRGSTHSLCLHHAGQVPLFREIAQRIRAGGAVAALQVMHAGGQANETFTGHAPRSPSGVACISTGCSSVPLTYEEIAHLRTQFLNTAELAAAADFQILELHLAHGYLLHEFLSPHTNHRTDAYGGTLENRARLTLEIVAEIRERLPHLILGARISGEDYLDDGITREKNRDLLPLLERSGIQYFHVTAGIYDTGKTKHAKMQTGEFFTYARYVKELVRGPVIGVGKLLDLDQAERHLIAGDCDLVAIGRGLLADPDMVNKVLHAQPFNRCIECRKCMYLKYGREYLKCPIRPT